MQDKIYFEMTDGEKVYNHIQHDLDWATCMLAEGIQIDSVNEEEIEKLTEKLLSNISEANDTIYRILKLVRQG